MLKCSNAQDLKSCIQILKYSTAEDYTLPQFRSNEQENIHKKTADKCVFLCVCVFVWREEEKEGKNTAGRKLNTAGRKYCKLCFCKLFINICKTQEKLKIR